MSASIKANLALTRAEIGGLYASLMEDLKVRLELIQNVLRGEWESPSTPDWVSLEVGYLQLRQSCEIIALATLVAHNEFPEFRSKTLIKNWKASSIFTSLLKLNEHAFPRPVDIHLDYHGPGQHHVATPLPTFGATNLADVYHACGDRLHVGSLQRLLARKVPIYDRREIRAWHNELVKLLTTHMVMLPEIRSTLIVILKHVDDGNVHCIFADADGPSVLVPGSNQLDFQIDESVG